MKHFQYLSDHDLDNIFYIRPEEFSRFTEREVLRYALGATLYMPSKKNIVKKIKNKELHGLTSMVMCFEDSIREEEVEEAENNVIFILNELKTLISQNELSYNDIPLFFLRVRNVNQFNAFLKKLNKEDFNILTGFIFPKFNSLNADSYLSKIEELNNLYNIPIYGMPILESKDIIYSETRANQLLSLRETLSKYKDYILNLRVGGTDFSSRFGLRRSIDYTIYDIGVVSNCLYDILNFFAREEEDYTISAPVWEYFPGKRLFKPKLRKTPFNINDLRSCRNEIIDTATDGLIRETVLDKANGFIGKTIIHPSHITFVNALHSVTKEEYLDAKSIIENQGGGVLKGTNNNKMNEINPHTNWAKKIINKSKVYGVINNGNDYVKLF